MLTEQYYIPQTSVDDRIDRLILAEPNQPDLLAHRRCQAAWLKRIMTACWPLPRLPGPSSDSTWRTDTSLHPGSPIPSVIR